jgi:hypothetical protein
MTYRLAKLAAGSYDVILDGAWRWLGVSVDSGL